MSVCKRVGISAIQPFDLVSGCKAFPPVSRGTPDVDHCVLQISISVFILW
jgi:hypothetical protein